MMRRTEMAREARALRARGLGRMGLALLAMTVPGVTTTAAGVATAAGAMATMGRAALQAQVSSSASSRSCERGGEPRPSLGIGTFHCRGGSCLVGGIYATRRGLPSVTRALLEADSAAWDFSVEPTLWEIRPDGPAAGRVEEGDELVAVAGLPVTTREAGAALAGLQPGTPMELTLRRSGAHRVDDHYVVGSVVRVEIVPVESCASFTVSSGPGETPGYLERDARGRVVRRGEVPGALAPVPEEAGTARFEGAGLVLAGPTEIRVAAGWSAGWRFTGDAVVADVVEGGAADRAGLVPGEVVVSADDEPLDTVEGVAALAQAGPDRPVLLFVRRGRSGRQVVIHER